jgi:Glycosyltransferase family 9 (heptosyltransferase)
VPAQRVITIDDDRNEGASVAIHAKSADKALRLHRRALRLEREHRLDEALACQIEATSMAPRMSLMHRELGRFLMRRGEFRPGLTAFERHSRLKGRVPGVPRLPVARWNGLPLPRGRILLVADQGAGDMVQFARYIPLVSKRCREVVLAAPPELAELLGSAKGVTKVITRYEDIGHVDAYCILSSLPFVLGTTLETIPANAPYLTVDRARVAAWRAKLDSRTAPGLPRVGIAWAGDPAHPDDRWRSTRLAAWDSVLDVRGVSFISLQKWMPTRDRGFAAASRLIELTDGRDDFADTAALIQALDLIVSVDTSIAHIAGALAKPAWVLLARLPDWRWLLNREDSPWYPTLRLFRQDTPDRWDGPFRRIAARMRADFATHSTIETADQLKYSRGGRRTRSPVSALSPRHPSRRAQRRLPMAAAKKATGKKVQRGKRASSTRDLRATKVVTGGVKRKGTSS